MTLHALSPLDGRYHRITDRLRPYFSEAALIEGRIFIEVEYLKALLKTIPEGLSVRSFLTELDTLTRVSEEDLTYIKHIEMKVNHDVKAVEYFLREKLEKSDIFSPFVEFIHFGLTSEDINNLAYAQLFKHAIEQELYPLIHQLLSMLEGFSHRYAKIPMLSRTHGQSATPTTIGKEFKIFHYRLDNALKTLEKIPHRGKLNGATGNFNAHVAAYPNVNWPEFSNAFILSLDLEPNPLTTQIESHDGLAELCHGFARIHTILTDLSRDCWGYISLNYFSQTPRAEEVGSSTMPHKINPIDFENAEGNLGLSNALLTHFAEKLPISRFQRDLSDSTVMRSVGSAFAYGLIAYESLLKGLKKLSTNEPIIEADLNNHPEVLAEAIQTVLRKYGKPAPYEQLKTLTRGKKITLETMQNFIETLDLPKEEILRLKALTPSSYVGLASLLAKD
jgi:adenylosuccinate lyase